MVIRQPPVIALPARWPMPGPSASKVAAAHPVTWTCQVTRPVRGEARRFSREGMIDYT
jgi:hypothetical protein